MILGMGSGLVLSILGFWLMFAGFITFGITSVLVGFYLMLGGVLMILGELQFEWFITRVSFLASYAGRGVFYFFIGSLTFVIFGVDSIVSIFLMIVGSVVMVLGIVYIVFHFFGHRLGGGSDNNVSAGGSAYEVEYGTGSSNYAGKELEDPNFDPNNYGTASSGIDIGKSSQYGAPQAGSPSDYGLQAP